MYNGIEAGKHGPLHGRMMIFVVARNIEISDNFVLDY